MTLPSIALGILGKQSYHLSLSQSAATIMFFGTLGSIFAALVATLGPKTGLRTMVITRFSSGHVGGVLYSILNILTSLGWSVTGVILGGQALASINPGSLSLVTGIIIIALLSALPSFAGYDMVHRVAGYAWIPTFFVMLCLWGLGAVTGFHSSSEEPDNGRALPSDILSFGGIVFAFAAGIAPIAADYNCHLPANTSAMKVFLLNFCGIFIPGSFAEILGAALVSIKDPTHTSAFENGGTVGLLYEVLSPWNGFGKFLIIILAFSETTGNIVNVYSTSLSIQALGSAFAAIPRAAWAVVGTIAYTIAGVAGRQQFAAFLSNFLAILSYWTAWFVVIIMEEHFIFRRKGGGLMGYNLDDWGDTLCQPLGIAGIVAACFGAAGAIVGMSTIWFTGPLGKLAGGETGADLGFELATCFAAITFPPLRWLEIQYTGR